MIVTNLSTLKETFPKIWEYANIAVNAKELGRTEINGNLVFYTKSEDQLEPETSRRLEVHEQYMDVQIVLEGKERYGYIPGNYIGSLEEDRLKNDDLAFTSKSEPCQYVDLKANDLVIFLPGHAHKPLCQPDADHSKVVKTIIKIHRSLIPELWS